jgi:pectate lyase
MALLYVTGYGSARADYVACYTDKSVRALPRRFAASGATVDSCVAAAKAASLSYAGLQYGGECWGGNTLGYDSVNGSQCNMPCSANSAETCGGVWRNSIYSTSTTPTPTPTDSYSGCYTDKSARALPWRLVASGATVDSCVAAAKAASLSYAGLQYSGECWGGNTLGYDSVDSSQCNLPCSANPAETCGGVWRNSIYSTSATPTPTPAPSPAPTPAPTPPPTSAAPPSDTRAFPGAEGGGALSLGGRGGRVILVTSLADSGTGSLRACMEASGPRTCVFTVSGTIRLSSYIAVSNPYLTVAGQTAPGAGIQVVAATSTGGALIWNSTHDTIIRYIRVRNGPTAFSYQPASGSGLNGAYNNVLDHVSMQYCGNDCISVGQPPGRYIQNGMTLSWLLNAESVNTTTSRTAMIMSSENASLDAQVVDIDIHHSYLATHSHRFPKAGYGRMRLVNNIIFNSDFVWTQLEFAAQVDIIGNIYKEGSRLTSEHPVHMYPSGAKISAYVANNVSTRYLTSSGAGDVAEWNALVRQTTAENGEDGGRGTVPSTSTYRRSGPFATRTRGRNITPLVLTGCGANLEALLLKNGPADGSGPVGASRRLDCEGNWVGSQDALDARIVNYYAGGSPPSNHPNVSDLGSGVYRTPSPSLVAGSACAGLQTRGIPDAWVNYWKMQVSPAASDLTPTGKEVPAHLGWAAGYTNLDVYLSGMAPAL